MEHDELPKFCPFCNINIKSYLNTQKEKEEYAAIRNNVILRAQLQLDLGKKERLEEQEKQRKLELEDKIKKELGLDKKRRRISFFSNRPINKNHWIGAFSLVLVSSFTVSWYLFQEDKNKTYSDASLSPSRQITPTELVAFASQGMVNSSGYALALPEELPTKADIDGVVKLTFIVRRNRATPQSIIVNERIITFASESQVKSGVDALDDNWLFGKSLFGELDADIEWEAFLNKKINQFIEAGKIKSAFVLCQYQPNLDDHIKTISRILAVFSEMKRTDLFDLTVSKLNGRIDEQPWDSRPIYMSQLALSLKKLGKKTSLYEDAEKLVTKISDPVKQSWALSEIAVHLKNAGESQAADDHFVLAEKKLKQDNRQFEKFLGYVQLAHDHYRAGNGIYGKVALLEAEILSTNLSNQQHEDSLIELIKVAYEINDDVLIEKFSSLLRSPFDRSTAAYQYILSQLKNDPKAAISKQLSIANADFSVASTAIAATLTTEPEKQEYLLNEARQQLLVITDNESKALAASKVARVEQRLGYTSKSALLFEQAFNWADSIQDRKRKDLALSVLSVDQARSFTNDNSRKIAALINNQDLRSDVLEIINVSQHALMLVD